MVAKQRLAATRRTTAILLVLLMVLGALVILQDYAKAADVTFVEDPSNPVFDPSHEAYYPCVLYDDDRFSGHGEATYYKMWFAGHTPGSFEALSTSSDGRNWSEPVEMQGIVSSGYHAKIVYMPDGYGAGPYYYKIWYWDPSVSIYAVTAMRTADSVDGVTWVNDQVLTQDAGAPIVTGVSPDWNRGTYGPVTVFYNPYASNTGGDPFDYSFTMYYDGTTGGLEVIGLGYSIDGNHWYRYGNDPVLDHGAAGEWDSDYSTAGTVIKEGDGSWHLWYSGSGPSGGANKGIGYATSTNGINWTRDPGNPMMHISDGVPWRDDRCYTPSVLYSPTKFDGHGDNCSWKMWWTGQDAATSNRAVGYAGSSEPALAIDKSADPADIAEPGGTITYSITASNSGTGQATDASITDSIPADTEYIAGSTTLNGNPVSDLYGNTPPFAGGMNVNSPGAGAGIIVPGGQAVVGFQVRVAEFPQGDGRIINTATLSSDGVPPISDTITNASILQPAMNWYFAEGSTQPGFDEYILIENPEPEDANITVNYMTEDGREKQVDHVVPAESRKTVRVIDEMPNEVGVSAVIRSDRDIICERTMYFNFSGIEGGHDALGVNAPSVDQYLAEGFTGWAGNEFDEWILILNPGTTGADVSIEYLFPGNSVPELRHYEVPAKTRKSISVDFEVGQAKEVSAHITSDVPVVAERAMYFNYQGKWTGGHCEHATSGTKNDWYLAEGFTGSAEGPFDEWILVANQNDRPAEITVTYMFPDGDPQIVDYQAPANGRLTIGVNRDVGEFKMVSTHINSSLPVVVERAMYFDFRNKWSGGHDSLGAEAPVAEANFAEGYTGNEVSQFETWLLIQNTTDEEKVVTVDYFVKEGDNVRREMTLPPLSRTTVLTNEVLGRSNLEFSMRVSTRDGTASIQSERAVYFDYAGTFGHAEGGHDVLGY
ncbi:MAG: DUF11 domain-containing protein [Actinobacteria bacterium]|nr:DUF11 domain-containing protein [Actinomycetota bacterium]